MPNESARSFSYLAGLFGIGRSDSQSPANDLWDQTRKAMLARASRVMYEQDWLSDFWLARGSKIVFGFLTPTWDPPELIDSWPFDGRAIVAATSLPSRNTNHVAFLKVLQDNTAPLAPPDPQALADFLQWRKDIKRHADARMIQIEHVRAWLGASLGHLLMSIVLSPEDGSPALVNAAITRLHTPLELELPGSWMNEFEERRLELLFNLRIGSDGKLGPSDPHVGQGEEWREHWGWLSSEIGASQALDSLQLAARLMRCPSLVTALIASLSSNNQYLQTVALAVLRRWLLTLKVMTWLELALTHSWKFARAQDLCCVAFNALKPEWPRRLLAISHRSADVKSELMGMKLWKSSRCAIDANYVPSWETNTGMMWGLFAAVPVIARIESPRYRASIWCQREIEVTDYLAEHCDFLSDRWLLDVQDSKMRDLDDVSVVWEKDSEQNSSGMALFNSFPPLCQVWAPQPIPEWEVKMFRAAGALRMMNAFLSDPARTNALADYIYSGLDLPGPAPTNNPDGWQAYAEIFRDLRSLDNANLSKLPIHLPSTYAPEERLKDVELGQRIPDLSDGTFDLRDILVAFEWLRTEWPIMLQQRRGDFIVLNCQRLTKDQWEDRVELSLHRGLAGIRLPGPLWFLQLAGQAVENWSLVGERPIFTEHVSEQFAWMIESFFEERESQSRYPADSGVELSQELAELCAKGIAPKRDK